MPEEGRLPAVVVNSTPIITLAIIDQLPLLRKLYGTVLIPSAVQAEVLAGGPNRPGMAQLEAAPWVETVNVEDPRRADLKFEKRIFCSTTFWSGKLWRVRTKVI